MVFQWERNILEPSWHINTIVTIASGTLSVFGCERLCVLVCLCVCVFAPWYPLWNADRDLFIVSSFYKPFNNNEASRILRKIHKTTSSGPNGGIQPVDDEHVFMVVDIPFREQVSQYFTPLLVSTEKFWSKTLCSFVRFAVVVVVCLFRRLELVHLESPCQCIFER